jgi:hypothetical protein
LVCPEAWWSYGPIGYRLLIGADLNQPDLVLEIQFAQSILVKVIVIGVILAGLLGLAVVLIRVTTKANDRRQAKRLLLSFLRIELLLGDPSIPLSLGWRLSHPCVRLQLLSWL